jgi:hypothetical protein
VCTAEPWSQAYVDCVSRAPDVWSTMVCRRGGEPASTAPVADDGADITCAAVGRNMARLVGPLGAMLDVPDDARESVTAELDALHGNLETSCEANDWPAAARRCYATAASLFALEACK